MRRRSTSPALALAELGDAELLLLVSRRDLHALEVIYDRYIEAAWGVALKFSEDVVAAEKAVAAAFLHMWRKPEPRDCASLPARLLWNVKHEASRAPGAMSRPGNTGAAASVV